MTPNQRLPVLDPELCPPGLLAHPDLPLDTLLYDPFEGTVTLAQYRQQALKELIHIQVVRFLTANCRNARMAAWLSAAIRSNPAYQG